MTKPLLVLGLFLDGLAARRGSLGDPAHGLVELGHGGVSAYFPSQFLEPLGLGLGAGFARHGGEYSTVGGGL